MESKIRWRIEKTLVSNCIDMIVSIAFSFNVWYTSSRCFYQSMGLKKYPGKHVAYSNLYFFKTKENFVYDNYRKASS